VKEWSVWFWLLRIMFPPAAVGCVAMDFIYCTTTTSSPLFAAVFLLFRSRNKVTIHFNICYCTFSSCFFKGLIRISF
jgi:hypothetical protein